MSISQCAAPDDREAHTCSKRAVYTFWGAAALAAAFAIGHKSLFFSGEFILPGIGLGISVWAFLGLCILYLGTAHLRASLFPLLCTLVLSATLGIYANDVLRIMNLPVLVVLTGITAFSLAGDRELLSARGLTQSMRRICTGFWPHLCAPLHLFRRSASRNTARGVLQGAILCIPVLGIVLLLLSDADTEFRTAIGQILQVLPSGEAAEWIWNVLRFAILTLVLFAFIYALNHAKPAREHSYGWKLRSLSLSMLLVALCLAYAFFLAIQLARMLAYLPKMDYAASARAGFFQLVVVAMITLLVALPALCMHPKRASIRVLSALAALLTMGIVATALWRMVRYIQAYGWTLLRAVTLWGMLAITAALLATLIKCARPSIEVCRALAAFTLITWIAFNYTNIDARIAEANVAAYQSGSLETLDVAYLAELSPDVLPALQSVEDTRLKPLILLSEIRFAQKIPRWYDWSLSWLKADPSAVHQICGFWQLFTESLRWPSDFHYNSHTQMRLDADGSGQFYNADGTIGKPLTWRITQTGIQVFEQGNTMEDWFGTYFSFEGNTLRYISDTFPDLRYVRIESDPAS